MTTVRYHTILELQCTHSYFENNTCPVLRFLPLVGTQAVFKNYELIQRENTSGFALYAGASDQQQFNAAEHLHGMPDLFFKIQVEDPIFLNYTNLPFLKENELFYFSAAQNNQLQKNDHVSEQDAMPLYPLVFSVPLDGNNGNKKISIQNEKGVTVIAIENITPSQPSITLDLSAHGPGSYTLWVDGEHRSTFFASDDIQAGKTIGVVRVTMQNLLAFNANSQPLQLHFIARLAFWQYHIVFPEKRQIELVEVAVESSVLGAFEGPEAGALTNGQSSQLFCSATPLPLQKWTETPNLLVTYVNNFSNSKNQIKQKLPLPDAAYFSGQRDNQFIISTIVYF